MTVAARSPKPSSLRRGACPSVATPMQTGDGLLVRLRPKAAGLAARNLLAIARLARETGNGLIEITARGNLQIRGLRAETVPGLAAGLAAAGIELLTGVVVETPPLAGVDPEETADPRPLADAIRDAAADAAHLLAPKLAIVVDGGGSLSLADAVADIRLDAVAGARWRLALGGDRVTARAVGLVPSDRVVTAVLCVLHALVAHGPAARGRDLDADRLRAGLDMEPSLDEPHAPSRHPLGLHPVAGEMILGLSPAYGQMHADRLAGLVSTLDAIGAREFRLAPHRVLLVRGLSGPGIEAARTAARRHGFWCDSDAPGRAISVCAGSAGCASATFDTHAAADAILEHAADLLDGSLDVHVSGCAKGCAHPAPAGVTLCGTAAGIGLVLAGRAGDATVATVAPEALGDAIGRLGNVAQSRRMRGESTARLLERVPADRLSVAYQGLS